MMSARRAVSRSGGALGGRCLEGVWLGRSASRYSTVLDDAEKFLFPPPSCSPLTLPWTRRPLFLPGLRKSAHMYVILYCIAASASA